MDIFVVAIVSFVGGIGVGMLLAAGSKKQDGYCSECKRMFQFDSKWDHLCPHCGARIGIPPPKPWPHPALPVRRQCGM